METFSIRPLKIWTFRSHIEQLLSLTFPLERILIQSRYRSDIPPSHTHAHTHTHTRTHTHTQFRIYISRDNKLLGDFVFKISLSHHMKGLMTF